MTDSPAISRCPVWDSVEGEINCPLCDYNLRGLPEPRCPECGYRFDWPDLLDPTRRKHPFVFEHHPKRNVWSFAKTLWAGTRPTRFWRSLHPAQPASLKRLVLYVGIVATFVVSAHLPGIAAEAVRLNADFRQYRRWIEQMTATPQSTAANLKSNGYRSVSEWLDTEAPRPLSLSFARELARYAAQSEGAGLLCAVYIAWPILTFAALSIFHWSMRRARVRMIHVFRCVAYTFDTAVWMVLAFLVAGSAVAAYTMSFLVWSSLLGLLLLLGLASLLIMTYRLSVAYRVYLQFDRPLATVAASQTIVVLVMLKTVSWVVLGA